VSVRSERLILLPPVDSKENYLNGFWKWVEFLATDNYQGALDGLHWPRGTTLTAEALKHRVTTFFGGAVSWSVVVPNERLIGVINDAAEYQAQNQDGWGWLLAQVPLTTAPADPKDDEIPLMGLASSFFRATIRPALRAGI
jgi:hypothetical protein